MTRMLSIALILTSGVGFMASFTRSCEAQVAPGTPPIATDPAKATTVRRGPKSKLVIPLPPEYQAKDKNGDGQIGLYEWERSKYAEFFKLDKNGDGFLTALELTAKGAGHGAKALIGAAVQDKTNLPTPVNLVAYNSQKPGEAFTFTVTGQTAGVIWGAGIYTTDSDLATAAVHAGVLKDGESGLVKVTMVAPPEDFMASTANGVTSRNLPESYPAAFSLSRP